MSNNIKIVIGSWGSYNECNERALGSKWLDLSDYSDWDEIVEELKKEGFELDGIDEELFIQDVEGIEDRSVEEHSSSFVFVFFYTAEKDTCIDFSLLGIFAEFLIARNFKTGSIFK